ncbi:hypothetical protein, partial [Bradyrhizobium sp. AUGA SZCCT0176]|uniref:hypothetical protein n=1 Tax=Bradyrhizobium sp. AUGA SZCCT0176 TaxID=2807664 RepID=UPI001BA482C9
MKSASAAVPVIVTVTDAVLTPVSAPPPLVNVNVPRSSAVFCSLIVADCVGVSFPTASEATFTANVTAWSISVRSTLSEAVVIAAVPSTIV